MSSEAHKPDFRVGGRGVCGVCGVCGVGGDGGEGGGGSGSGEGGGSGDGGKEVQLRDPVLTGASHRCSRAGPSTSSPT